MFLIDQCLGRVNVAAVVRHAGHDVRLLADEFRQDARDEEWLLRAGTDHWVVLTKDRHFKKRPIELRAVLAAKVRVFVLTAAGLPAAEQAAAFRNALPKITRVCHQRGPLIGNVTASGAVTVSAAQDLKRWLRAAASSGG